MSTLHIRNVGLWSVALLLLFGISACDLDVPAPALIEDDDLLSPLAVNALVNGAHGDFALATAADIGGVYLAGALLTDELVHVGSYVGFRGVSNGLVRDDYVEANSWWGQTSRARWVAENGITRIQTLLDDGDLEADVANAAIAELSLYAGLSNRVLGDHFDFAVIDGGSAEARAVFYERALGHFDRTIALAGASSSLGLAAQGGKVQALVSLGRWADAMAISGAIPTAFRFEQVHSQNSAREENMIHWWAHDRNECSVWGTPFEPLGLDISEGIEGDARIIYETFGAGGDDRRPFLRQKKYLRASNIGVVKGTEMRLLEAEYALRNGDPDGMVDLINEVRQNFNENILPGFQDRFPELLEYELVDMEYAEVNTNNAWQVLMEEMGLELWLEGRRIAHLRRWQSDPGQANVPFQVVRQRGTGGPETDPLVSVYDVSPDLYLMVSRHEKDSNTNVD
jgi:starch-binding outer membrane protein, SusD/RagB family